MYISPMTRDLFNRGALRVSLQCCVANVHYDLYSYASGPQVSFSVLHSFHCLQRSVDNFSHSNHTLLLQSPTDKLQAHRKPVEEPWIVYNAAQIISAKNPRREQFAERTKLVNCLILMVVKRMRGRGPVERSIRVRHRERARRVVQRVRQRRVERVPA